jgi:hypothetical protein
VWATQKGRDTRQVRGGVGRQIGRGVEGLYLQATIDGADEAVDVTANLFVGELFPGGQIKGGGDVDHDTTSLVRSPYMAEARDASGRPPTREPD